MTERALYQVPMKTTGHIIVLLTFLFTQGVVAQKYFKIDNDLVDEITFRKGLAAIAQEYNPQIVTYKTFERVTAQDSIIENIAIVVMTEEDDTETYRVFDFLGQPLPDFEFNDTRGAAVSKSKFLGKYTVVGLYKDPSQIRKSHVKGMNALTETGLYNAVSLIAKNGERPTMAKKADFPILNECISWYIDNISIPEDPKFLVLDETGKLRYIYQQFPDKNSTTTPIDSVHLKIFDILK